VGETPTLLAKTATLVRRYPTLVRNTSTQVGEDRLRQKKAAASADS
jgi:hypothetical protein